MYALSLWQPWASWMAAGLKPIENRDWKQPNAGACLLGQDVALQAANHFDENALPFARQHLPDLLPQLAEPWGGWPTGVVLAVVKVEHIIRRRDDLIFDDDATWALRSGHVTEPEMRWYMLQRVALVCRDLRRLALPVRVKGHQRLWRLSPDEEKAVRAQLGSGPRGLLEGRP